MLRSDTVPCRSSCKCTPWSGRTWPEKSQNLTHSTIPTLFIIDTVGRRKLCLITFPLMCIFLLAAGLSLLNHHGSRAGQVGPVVLFVYLFTIA